MLNFCLWKLKSILKDLWRRIIYKSKLILMIIKENPSYPYEQITDLLLKGYLVPQTAQRKVDASGESFYILPVTYYSSNTIDIVNLQKLLFNANTEERPKM